MKCTHQFLLLLFACLLANVSRVLSQCIKKTSVSSHVLKNHVTKSMKTADVVDCLQQCTTDREAHCQSINYYLSGLCELNNKTKEQASQNDFQQASTGYYMPNDNPAVHCSTRSTRKGHCCVFPFNYHDRIFDSCTTYRESSGLYWCSLTTNYESKWDYCV
ncbi:uncharacterized protein LOC116303013 [Actinia tenebrosa]|uniref:Uncharacterized protein LOC116303013 n=1 Tax=Actinia tenebrosa TaxID=6105 RepID=A0A6P8IMQ2_ACTTE|nr:uncharacterized protein LOC116303013 [Actinia tenebrosa]